MLIEAGTTIVPVTELVPMAGTLIEVVLTGTLIVAGMTGTKAEMAMGDTKGQLEIKAEEGTARGSKRMIIVIVANIRIGDTCHSQKLTRARETTRRMTGLQIQTHRMIARDSGRLMKRRLCAGMSKRLALTTGQ